MSLPAEAIGPHSVSQSEKLFSQSTCLMPLSSAHASLSTKNLIKLLVLVSFVGESVAEQEPCAASQNLATVSASLCQRVHC